MFCSARVVCKSSHFMISSRIFISYSDGDLLTAPYCSHFWHQKIFLAQQKPAGETFLSTSFPHDENEEACLTTDFTGKEH